MIKAWLYGIVIIILVDVIWAIALLTNIFSGSLLLAMELSPLLGAIISSYLAPTNKLLLGVSLAIPTAIFTVLFNSIYQLYGHRVDFPGLHGGVILLSVSLIYSFIICLFGGVVGLLLVKIKQYFTSTHKY